MNSLISPTDKKIYEIVFISGLSTLRMKVGESNLEITKHLLRGYRIESITAI